jgi:hypothetical protein
MNVNVLGVIYEITEASPKTDENLKDADGYVIFYDKRIVLSDLSDWDKQASELAKDIYRKQNLRHELIHAFLYESGLAYNSNGATNWAMNEEMVDWIAIQMPKIMDVYESVSNSWNYDDRGVKK